MLVFQSASLNLQIKQSLVRSGLSCYVKQCCQQYAFQNGCLSQCVCVWLLHDSLWDHLCACAVSRHRFAGAEACGWCGGTPRWIISCIIKKSQEVIVTLLILHQTSSLYTSCVRGASTQVEKWNCLWMLRNFPCIMWGGSLSLIPYKNPKGTYLQCNNVSHTFVCIKHVPWWKS